MSAPEPTADLDELRATVTRADAAYRKLESTGGLLSIPDIAARWGVDKETVRGYRARRDDFPQAVGTIGRSEVWTAAAIDLWRATPRKPGRRKARPDA